MSYRIDDPCDEDWNAMELRGAGRYCQSCEHVVVDASTMTEKELAAHFEESGGNLCAQLRVNPVGDAIFRRPAPRRAGLGSFVLLSVLTAGGCGTEAPQTMEVDAPVAVPLVEPSARPINPEKIPPVAPIAPSAPIVDPATQIEPTQTDSATDIPHVPQVDTPQVDTPHRPRLRGRVRHSR